MRTRSAPSAAVAITIASATVVGAAHADGPPGERAGATAPAERRVRAALRREAGTLSWLGAARAPVLPRDGCFVLLLAAERGTVASVLDEQVSDTGVTRMRVCGDAGAALGDHRIPGVSWALVAMPGRGERVVFDDGTHERSIVVEPGGCVRVHVWASAGELRVELVGDDGATRHAEGVEPWVARCADTTAETFTLRIRGEGTANVFVERP